MANSFAEVLAGTAGARGALQTFWSLAIANLADYLAGRELTPKCDFTSNELRASVVIDAAPEQVFDSMTQPEQFCRWFGVNVGIEPYAGGALAAPRRRVPPRAVDGLAAVGARRHWRRSAYALYYKFSSSDQDSDSAMSRPISVDQFSAHAFTSAMSSCPAP